MTSINVNKLHYIHFFYLQALIGTFYKPEGVLALGSRENENAASFLLEMLLKIVLQNR
jgi:hypothetical protein